MRFTATPATYAFVSVLGLVLGTGLLHQHDVIRPSFHPNFSGAVAIDVGSRVSSRPELATPTPTPTPVPLGPPSSVLDKYRVLTYYGHPMSEIMGILGEAPVEVIGNRLKEQASAYAIADPTMPVKPAIHFIYSVAHPVPGSDGLYMTHTEDSVVKPYVDYARQNDMLLFLDLQNGRSDIGREVESMLPYLKEPNVHLALDPEFTMPPGQVPGREIGTLTAAQINRAQEILQNFVIENRLPNKILIVHQFQEDMVTGKEAITNYDRVDLVFDMDGWGAPADKITKYLRFATTPPSDYGAIKLFYKWDVPVLTPTAIMALDPKPNIIIYQ
jgi:hypothetical protein